MSAKPLLVFGAGGHGREVSWIVSRAREYVVVAFLDETSEGSSGVRLDGVPVVDKKTAGVHLGTKGLVVFSATGILDLRRRWAEEFSGLPFATIVDPTALVGPRVEIGPGTVVFPNCVLSADVSIGVHVSINAGCTINHDTKVGDFTNLGPGCHLPGRVTIGAGCDLGTGVVVLPGVSVGAGAIIGAGAVVTRDVPASVVAVGVPARVLGKK